MVQKEIMLYYPVNDISCNNYPQSKILNNIVYDIITGCWIWTIGTCTEGYGRFRHNGSIYRTHRYMYLAVKGEIPNGYLVRHLCHNRACCNLEHLMLGTDLDNWHDSADIHYAVMDKLKKRYIINGVVYNGTNSTARELSTSSTTLIKYTDPYTRVFNYNAYCNGCYTANVIPAF